MAEKGPVVSTPLGKVLGSIYTTDRGETIYSFQGIPYAKPPVGDLRFKAPVEIEPWTGVRSAENAPPLAASSMLFPGGDFFEMPGTSEDCLYVNVYTPQVPQSGLNLPVMAYIHGGGFSSGSGNQTFCGPDYLVPKGVILVTINYRCGAFGFLSLKTAECPGNYGLKDQSLALKWIQSNIGAFGGDSNNVTLFGESAGAASVQYQMLSPLSRGLFRRCIAQSGSVLNRWAFSRHPAESAALLAKRLGSYSNDAADVLDTIKKASTKDILVKSVGIFQEIEGQWAGEQSLCFPFVPTVEPTGTPNAFLIKTPAQAIEDGDYADIPYITGVCADESLLCLPSPDYKPPDDDPKVHQLMLPKELEIPLDTPKMREAATKLKKFYFPEGSTQEGWIKAHSTLNCIYGVFKTVEAHAENPNKTTPDYLYVFNYSRNPSVMKKFARLQDGKGVCHADDLEFVFRMSGEFSRSPAIAKDTADDRVKETVTKLWTDFAKTGTVSSEWSVADPKQGYPYLEIAETIQPKTGFFADDIKFWEELYQFLKF